MARKPQEPDWKDYLDRWDRQREEFNPDRDRRFEAMFEVLAAKLPKKFTALDLGCGPGSFTSRMLHRFPQARSVAVDFDPVVLRIGKGALGTMGGLIIWIEAMLGEPGWARHVLPGKYDAAPSTTALHWLGPRELRTLYADLHRLLRQGGVFLNWDILPVDQSHEPLRRIAERIHNAQFGRPKGRPAWAGWKRWERAEKDPFLRPAFEERKAEKAGHHPPGEPLSLAFHERALRRAGFREVVWQDLDNRVLLAIR